GGTALRVNRRPGWGRRLIARVKTRHRPLCPICFSADGQTRRFGATGLRSERHAGRRLQPAECLSCRIGHRSKSSAKGRGTELSAEGRFGTKCGCCLVALTTAAVIGRIEILHRSRLLLHGCVALLGAEPLGYHAGAARVPFRLVPDG